MKIKIFLLCSAFYMASNCLAETTVLTADAMVDVVTGKLIQNPTITIEEGRIIEIQRGEPAPSATSNIIKLNGFTLLPGMIDMHTHLTASADEHGYKRLATSQTRAALRGSKHAKDTLMAGVTTVRNLGAGGYIDVALRDSINAGEVLGPRMFVSGPSLGITGGHCDSNLLPYESVTGWLTGLGKSLRKFARTLSMAPM